MSTNNNENPEYSPVQRITVRHVRMMVDALNKVQDEYVSPMAKDYEWYTRGGEGRRIYYTLQRGGKIVIPGMICVDFYFACNAIAATIMDCARQERCETCGR